MLWDSTCYGMSVEANTMTEGHKMILKPEIPMMSWVLSEEHSDGDGSAQEGSIKKWKWCVQNQVPGEYNEEVNRELLFL